jgi:hypothetical protein
VVATENPVQRWDEETNQVVNEVLLMDGMELRAGRDQMPIVDSHDDTTVRNILGSIQRLQVDRGTGELYGVPVFASDPDAQTIQARMNEGHITDFSITAQPLESLFVPRGQSYTTNRGAVIDGPAIIVTRWQPHNASICATGADEYSTVRRSYTDLNRKVKRMNPELLAKLTAMGMPEGLTDPDAVLAWVLGKMPAAPMEEIENMDGMKEEMPPVEKMNGMEESVIEKAADMKATEIAARKAEAETLIKRALALDQKRRNEIQAAVKIAKLDQAFADELCNSQVSVADANARIIERMATQPLGTSVGADVRVTESGDDKFYAAVRDGLVKRAFASASVRTNPFAVTQAAPGHEDFKHVRLSRLAETFAEKMGAPVQRMAPKDIALVAMGHPGSLNRFNIVRRDAYHTTGSFSNLLLDAANKTLLAGYEEAPYTWNIWARQATSVDDFKNINRIRFSEMGTPEMVPENSNYPESRLADSKEVYRVEKYGSMFSVTWETVINDDLDAISRIPAMQGAACRRKQNQAVYSVLTSNPAMADTGALFNSTAQTTAGGHANLSGASAAPSVTTLNAMFLSMMTKTGMTVNGVAGPILNIQPSFLIVPAALSATALQLVGSVADPSVGGSTAGNSNTKNIYGPNADRPLRVVVEPVLDASSATAWYGAASTSQVDTIELSFLAGEESPVLENEWDFDKDVYKYKVRQTFGVAPIDFRGLYKYATA